MSARAIVARDRATFGGPWYWLHVLGLHIERRGRTFTTWTVDP